VQPTRPYVPSQNSENSLPSEDEDDPLKQVKQIETSTPELAALDGVKFLSFFATQIIVANYINKDLVQRNRWKDIEMIYYNRAIWALVVVIYMFVDLLLLLSAFFQTLKLVKLFQRKLRPREEKSSDSVSEFSASSSL